jgi:hypothetical protein
MRQQTEGIGNGHVDCVFTSPTCVVQLEIIGCFKKRVMFTNILFWYEDVIMLIFLDVELF